MAVYASAADVAEAARCGQRTSTACIYSPLRKPFITLYNQHFIEVYHFIF